MKLCYKKFLSDMATTDIGDFETPEEIAEAIKNYVTTNNLYPNRNYEELIHICLPYHWIFIRMDLEELATFKSNGEKDISNFLNKEEAQLFEEQFFIIKTEDKGIYEKLTSLLKTTK